MYGDFLVRVRRSRGMTQAQVAENSGISQPNLSAYENDRRVPTADVLNRILVSCGYQLAAVAGERVVTCDLPRGGWFPDEDDPGAMPGDPPDEVPLVTATTPMAERLRVINAVLGVES